MTEFNFPQPLRLARGSHKPGSGKGCAMNVVSWENGDTKITDYPKCSARPLARLVQILNDKLADDDGFLSPEGSLTVLEIGHLTVGTSGYEPFTMRVWLRDLLMDDVFGVVNFVSGGAVRSVVERVASLLVDANATWAQFDDYAYAAYVADHAANVAAAVARAAARAATYAAAADNIGDIYAARAATYAAAADNIGDIYAADTADAAAAVAAAVNVASRTEYTRWAVQRFRDLMGLDSQSVDPAAVETAVSRMLTTN